MGGSGRSIKNLAGDARYKSLCSPERRDDSRFFRRRSAAEGKSWPPKNKGQPGFTGLWRRLHCGRTGHCGLYSTIPCLRIRRSCNGCYGPTARKLRPPQVATAMSATTFIALSFGILSLLWPIIRAIYPVMGRLRARAKVRIPLRSAGIKFWATCHSDKYFQQSSLLRVRWGSTVGQSSTPMGSIFKADSHSLIDKPCAASTVRVRDASYASIFRAGSARKCNGASCSTWIRATQSCVTSALYGI